ncbi:hypothetical protein Syun_007090 [Stephania yunnanensis]|uniref:Uncharacterized protein n=1 Tax=Stephania yunnanensis TaxID=152371 RepID=A0AAP0PZZ6_9MAGN
MKISLFSLAYRLPIFFISPTAPTPTCLFLRAHKLLSLLSFSLSAIKEKNNNGKLTMKKRELKGCWWCWRSIGEESKVGPFVDYFEGLRIFP